MVNFEDFDELENLIKIYLLQNGSFQMLQKFKKELKSKSIMFINVDGRTKMVVIKDGRVKSFDLKKGESDV